jgi:hypothetical protein
MNIIAISPADLPHWWPRLREGADKCLKWGMGLQTEASLYGGIEAGDFLLFVAMDGDEPVATVVGAIRQGDDLIFDVGYCWGTRVDDWIVEVYSAFELIGQQLGCKHMAFNGRPGWRKLARTMGFSINSMTYIKAI